MPIRLPRFFTGKKTGPPPEDYSIPLISTLGSKVTGDKIRVPVPVPAAFYADLYKFLDQMGYVSVRRDKEGIALLLEYGLSEENRDELEKNRRAKWGTDYAAKCFACFEHYKENGAITMGLRLHLQENKILKKELKENGLEDYVSEDEWDTWDDSYIDELYRRYVFCK